jgi:23S rRNA (cytosine1962-C5)-methyltransferase
MELRLQTPPLWPDYELIDSGNGAKLERFGNILLERPETQAIWTPRLPVSEWQRASAVFRRVRGDEGQGSWQVRRPVPDRWQLTAYGLTCWVRLTPFRHTGVFPEHSAHWDWLARQTAARPHARALVLFGYTGLSSLHLARSGAEVTHVDASKPAVRWAQENQELTGLADRPIRWLVDDVGKFVQREQRRGRKYDIILLDPPVFGRGPQGEIWRLQEQLPQLLRDCADLLTDRPLGVLVCAYATTISPLTIGNVLNEVMEPFGGTVSAGELALQEANQGRLLPAAIYAAWTNG